jgi:molybdopterin biosynthesis enzyme
VTDIPAPQRINRLTPRADLLRAFAALQPVEPARVALSDALGGVLAENVCAEGPMPPDTRANADGWAVAGADVAGAGSYGPAFLAPAPDWVDAGTPLPPNTDTVLAPEDLTLDGGMAQATADPAPGTGTRPAGADAGEGEIVLPQGRLIGALEIGVLAEMGMSDVALRRPRVRIVLARGDDRRAALLARLVEDAGSQMVETLAPGESAEDLSPALAQAGADLVLGIGGTGAGRNDHMVEALRSIAQEAIHGVALLPGTTAAFAMAPHPVLLLPGALEALLGGWLGLGAPLMARLAGRADEAPHDVLLTDKIASTIGLDEIFLLQDEKGGARPLPLAEASFAEIAAARRYVVVPAGLEGFAAGENVQAHAISPR